MALPLYLQDHKERYMTEETRESEELTNKEKYALLKEFHRTLRQVLTGVEYKVFCAIEDWSESKGECWHSQSTIADACDISRRSVNASIKELESLDLVESHDRFGQSSTYIPTKPTYAKIAYLKEQDTLRKNCTGRYAKYAQPPTQNMHTNVSNLNGSNNNVIKTTPNGVAAPPLENDFEVVAVYEQVAEQSSQQEQLPDALLPDTFEAVTPGPTSKDRAGLSLHIPRETQLDLTQEVKGFGTEGGGRDISSSSEPKSKARDKPTLKAKKQPRKVPIYSDDSPVIVLYKQKMNYEPNPNQTEKLIAKANDLDLLEEILDWWLGCGYKVNNVQGILDRYSKGVPVYAEYTDRTDRGRSERSPGKNRPDTKAPGPGQTGTFESGFWDRPDAEEVARAAWHV